jgi:small subunit ribosomal protein S3
MEERKFINLKKEEFGIKEYIKRDLGRGKISRLDIEYTPVGEKIIILTSKPGFVIGKKGEKIEELTQVLKTKFKLENPHIEINEIKNPLFDAQLVADEIAMALERMGNLKFKVIAYKKLQDIMNAGALGCELRTSGKLPSDRAKSWRFAEGYLKKAGESRKEVNRAQAVALTKSGIIGVKVAIMPPDAIIYDKINIDERIKEQLKNKVTEKEEIKKKPKNKDSKNITKTIKPKEKAEKSKKKSKKKIKEETNNKQVLAESDNLEIKPEEEGTAIKIEEELEEGVPQEQINKDLKKETKKKIISNAKKENSEEQGKSGITNIDIKELNQQKIIKPKKPEEDKE